MRIPSQSDLKKRFNEERKGPNHRNRKQHSAYNHRNRKQHSAYNLKKIHEAGVLPTEHPEGGTI